MSSYFWNEKYLLIPFQASFHLASRLFHHSLHLFTVFTNCFFDLKLILWINCILDIRCPNSNSLHAMARNRMNRCRDSSQSQDSVVHHNCCFHSHCTIVNLHYLHPVKILWQFCRGRNFKLFCVNGKRGERQENVSHPILWVNKRDFLGPITDFQFQMLLPKIDSKWQTSIAPVATKSVSEAVSEAIAVTTAKSSAWKNWSFGREAEF